MFLDHKTPWIKDEIEIKICDVLKTDGELCITDIARKIGLADHKSKVAFRCRRMVYLGFVKMSGNLNKRYVSLGEREA